MSALAGRRALVTGAGGGIGRGIAVELARQGTRAPAARADALVWLAELDAAAPLVGVVAGGETFR